MVQSLKAELLYGLIAAMGADGYSPGAAQVTSKAKSVKMKALSLPPLSTAVT